MKKIQIEVVALFAAAVTVRLLLFLPGFIQGGDAGQFATFVREIQMSGGGIPSGNSLYFPGTEYVYPPLLFLLVHFASSAGSAVFNAYLALRELLVFASIASAGTAVLIYLYARSNTSWIRNLVIGAVLVFFTPDLYALSWGGDPYILGEFLLIALLFTLSWREKPLLRWVPAAAILAVLIAIAHDLTWFFSMFSFTLIIVYDAVKGKRSVAVRELLPYAAGMGTGILWWIPRASFVHDALLVTQNQGYGGYAATSHVSPYLVVFVPFAISVIGIAVFALYRSNVKLSKVKWDPFIIALLSSLVFLFFMFKSFTLGGRIMYYSILLGSIVVLRIFGNLSGSFMASKEQERGMKTKHLPLVLLLILVLATVPFQAVNAHTSVDHYKTGYYQYDAQLLTWGKTNLGNGVVVAPNIGNYISAVDGSPVIIYGNFLVGGTQINQRDAALYIISHPASSTAQGYLQQYGIEYLVVNSSSFSSAQFPPSLYREVYHDRYYTVEKYAA